MSESSLSIEFFEEIISDIMRFIGCQDVRETVFPVPTTYCNSL